MDINLKLNKKNKVRQYPVKRSLNFAVVGVKKMNMAIAIPAIILIIVLAGVFAKFGVIDVMKRASDATAAVEALRTQVNEGYARIAELKIDSEEYSHYTYSDFTKEELTRADRIDVMDLVEEIVLPQATLNSMSIYGSVLSLNLTAGSLEELKKIAADLETRSDMVSYCTVTTATGSTYNSNDASTEYVTGQITVYLTSTSSLTGQADVQEGGVRA